MFARGDVVVCVDASGIIREARQLVVGGVYVISDVCHSTEFRWRGPASSPHQLADEGLRLVGIPMPHPNGWYAATRFEKCEEESIARGSEEPRERAVSDGTAGREAGASACTPRAG